VNDAVPQGAPLAAFLDGVLDGRIGDAAKLRAAAAALDHAGAGAFQCEVTGGRFTLLPIATTVAQPFGADAQERFLAALQAIATAASPGSLEGNLRCKLVWADEVAETLFVARGGTLEPVTRRRPRVATDEVPAPPTRGRLVGVRRREILWLVPVLALVAGAALWQSGVFARLFAAPAASLRTDSGPFDDLLALAIDSAAGDYEVTLRRGAGYPGTPQALAVRAAALTDLERRAACNLVGDGGDVYLELVDVAGAVLATTRIELRALLLAPDATVPARLPGHASADAVRLAIASRPR
jgi:hypothetical protein